MSLIHKLSIHKFLSYPSDSRLSLWKTALNTKRKNKAARGDKNQQNVCRQAGIRFRARLPRLGREDRTKIPKVCDILKLEHIHTIFRVHRQDSNVDNIFLSLYKIREGRNLLKTISLKRIVLY
jgi:hypothetical protein